MIVAGLALLAIGAADLVRQFVPARAVAAVAGGFCLLLLASLADAPVAGVLALAAAVGWLLLMPADGSARAGFWPPLTLGVGSAALVVLLPARERPGIVGSYWDVASPAGPLAFDAAVLVVGALVFAAESSNVIVRTALHDAMSPAAESDASVLRGGRLIGPLERVILFGLTLAAALPLAAALLAAKGIVRFPEISKDGAGGHRAEYFLVGSLVSWAIALALAVLAWWSLGPAS